MRRVNRITTVVALLAPLVAVVPAAAHARTPGPTDSAAAYSVTLLTGDRVDLTERADGRMTIAIQRAPGREHVTFVTSGRGDDLSVLPDDAAGPVASGAVDARLFQVRRLAHEGYDDRHRDDLPLIVTGAAAGLRVAD